MGSSQFVPWNESPARPFPALVWQVRRYGFRVPPSTFARLAAMPAQQREFPAKVWMRGRQKGG